MCCSAEMHVTLLTVILVIEPLKYAYFIKMPNYCFKGFEA